MISFWTSWASLLQRSAWTHTHRKTRGKEQLTRRRWRSATHLSSTVRWKRLFSFLPPLQQYSTFTIVLVLTWSSFFVRGPGPPCTTHCVWNVMERAVGTSTMWLKPGARFNYPTPPPTTRRQNLPCVRDVDQTSRCFMSWLAMTSSDV